MRELLIKDEVAALLFLSEFGGGFAAGAVAHNCGYFSPSDMAVFRHHVLGRLVKLGLVDLIESRSPKVYVITNEGRCALRQNRPLPAHDGGGGMRERRAHNPADVKSGLSGEWYCETHPEFLMGHDGCKGCGITADQRIPMLVNQRRLARQSVRECHHMYRDLAGQLKARLTPQENAGCE